MAANYITIGSKFQPFSFAEMLQPLQLYGTEYQRQEDLYNTYAENAGLIGADLDSNLDKDIIDNIYNPYMQELNKAAAELSSNGLSPGSRKNLQELRRRFGREITPIKLASDARAKARENWDKMLASDKSLMTNANPYYQGISAYINGKSPETSYVSGNELYDRGKALSEAFSKTMRNIPAEEALAIQGQYWRIKQQVGADSREMQDFMNGIIGSIPSLESQVDDILNNSGIYSKGFTQEDVNKARQYIIEGMKAGLSGNTKVQYLENKASEITDDTINPNGIFQQPTTTLGITPIDSQRKDNKRVALKDTVDEYEVLNYNGEDVLVPPILKAAYYYYSNPDFKEEYDSLRQEELAKVDKQYITEEGILIDPEGYAKAVAQVNNIYPSIPSESRIQRQIERQIKKNNKDLGSFDYLSPDKKLAASLGTRLNIQDNRRSLVWYNFQEVPSDVKNVINNITNSYSTVYEYDIEDQAISSKKPLSVSEQVKAFEDNDIVKIGRDGDFRLIVTTKSGKSYYVAGDDEMQSEQKINSAVMQALTYFGRDVKSTEGYKIPGIGNYNTRPIISSSVLNTMESGSNIPAEELSYYVREGIATPITVGADPVGFRITVTDSSTGLPVNIVLNAYGTIIDKLSAGDYVNGITPNIYNTRAMLSGISNSKYINSVN